MPLLCQVDASLEMWKQMNYELWRQNILIVNTWEYINVKIKNKKKMLKNLYAMFF